MGNRTEGTAVRVFFVHIMKTGGTSVLYHALRTIDEQHVWGPVFDGGSLETLYLRLDRYTSAKQVWAMGDWQMRSVLLFMGHFPWCATELVDPSVVTATVLRDPVERTVSYLRHCKQRHAIHAEMPLEQIYEDPWHFPRFVHDHQTKMMSLTLGEALDRPDPRPPSAEAAEMLRGLLLEGSLPPGAFLFEAVDPPLSRPIPMDRGRLDVALANLEQVEVLGVQERFDEWASRLSRRAGWADLPTTPHNVSEPGRVSEAFRRRIEADNALDVELYARARDLVAVAERAE